MAHLFFMVFPCLNLYLVCFFVADSVYCHNELGKNRAFFGIYRNTGVKKSEKYIELQKLEKRQHEHIGGNDTTEASQHPRTQRTLLAGEEQCITHIYGNVAYYRLHAASCYQ